VFASSYTCSLQVWSTADHRGNGVTCSSCGATAWIASPNRAGFCDEDKFAALNLPNVRVFYGTAVRVLSKAGIYVLHDVPPAHRLPVSVLWIAGVAAGFIFPSDSRVSFLFTAGDSVRAAIFSRGDWNPDDSVAVS